MIVRYYRRTHHWSSDSDISVSRKKQINKWNSWSLISFF